MKDLAQKYFELITGPEYSGLNLTALKTFDEIYAKQFLDSLIPLEQSKFILALDKSKYQIMDLGFGGGLPLLVLAYLFPANKILGIDARAKKAQAVNKIATQLNLNNVKAIHGRLEDVFIDKPALITFKAVGKIQELLGAINSNSEVICCFYKGPNLEDLEDIRPGKNWTLCEDISYDLSGQSGRRFLVYKLNVPRGTKSKHQLLSSYL